MPYKNRLQTQRITSHRYPYGLTFADAGKGSSLQPYKFGGKELDAMYELNIYDFHAPGHPKVATSAICGQANGGLFEFKNMEKYFLEIFLNQPKSSSINFDSTYKSYGNKFANSYKNVPNYNVPVKSVPLTLKYLLR